MKSFQSLITFLLESDYSTHSFESNTIPLKTTDYYKKWHLAASKRMKRTFCLALRSHNTAKFYEATF